MGQTPSHSPPPPAPPPGSLVTSIPLPTITASPQPTNSFNTTVPPISPSSPSAPPTTISIVSPPPSTTTVSAPPASSSTESSWSSVHASSSVSATANRFVAASDSIISSLQSQSTSETLSLPSFPTAPAPPPSVPPPSVPLSSTSSSLFPDTASISSPTVTHITASSAGGSTHNPILIWILAPVLVAAVWVIGLVVYRCRRRRTTRDARPFTELESEDAGSRGRTSTFFSPSISDSDAQSTSDDSALLPQGPETRTPTRSAAMLAHSGAAPSRESPSSSPVPATIGVRWHDTRTLAPSAAHLPRPRTNPFRAPRQPPSSSSIPSSTSDSDEKAYLRPSEKPSAPTLHPAIGNRWQPGHRPSPSSATRAPTFVTVDPAPRCPPPYHSSWRPLPRPPPAAV